MNKEQLINQVLSGMGQVLSKNQSVMLQECLTHVLNGVEISQKQNLPSVELCSNEEYIKNFLIVKKINGLQDSTLKAYRYTIKRFVEETRCNVITCDTNMIRMYLLEVQRSCNKTTADNARRNLNSFFQFLEDDGYILKNPCKNIPRIKEEKIIKKFATDLEIEMLRDSCISKKELALIDLLISCGLRVSEIPKIKLDDIDWDAKLILIHGKGAKERVVPMSVRAKKHLQEYIFERGRDKSIYLFCRDRAPFDKQMSKESMFAMFNKIRDRSGVPDITIHCMRRYFACSMNANNVSPALIQEIMGHESFNTTKRNYINNEDLIRKMAM